MKFLSIIYIFILFSFATQAQVGNQSWKKYRHEASIGYGFNSFLAAIGDDDKFGTAFLLQRSTVNASYRYYLSKHWAVRGSLSHAYSRKNDKENVEPARINSRLNYQMTLSEFSSIIEYHIFDETHYGSIKSEARRGTRGVSERKKIGVSLFAGAALNYMRPYAEQYGNRMVLKHYSSNAGLVSPKDYSKLNVHFPVGMNVRLVLTSNWRIGVEAGYRLGIRDYIGNVSTVYYADGNPRAQSSPEAWTIAAQSSAYTDSDFSGEYVSLDKETAPVSSLASESGRKNYFFGLLTLAYRIKS